jgi:hypothetical protein
MGSYILNFFACTARSAVAIRNEAIRASGEAG